MARNVSAHINGLFAAYVEIEARQVELSAGGNGIEADALGPQALETAKAIRAVRDRSGNPDLIAARLLLDLMLCHQWPPAADIDWSEDEQQGALPLLEAVADRTTGAVREQTRAVLATIGVHLEKPAADRQSAPIGHLMALAAASHKLFSAQVEITGEAEVSLPADSLERLHIEAKNAALCRIYNDALRAVIRAPVRTMEEASAKAAFLLRDEFDAPDLILGDSEETVVQLLRSLCSTPPTPFAAAFTTYCAELDAYNASTEDGDVSVIEDRLFAKVGCPPRMQAANDAATALRYVLKSDSIIDTFDETLVRGVLAFLEEHSPSDQPSA